jgi:hypothetical protein
MDVPQEQQPKVVHLYLLARRLQEEVLKKIPYSVPSLVPRDRVKKLSRRPMFEPLGNADLLLMMMSKSDSGGRLSSCSSKGKLCEDTATVADMDNLLKAQITPAAAWATAFPLIAQVLSPVGIPFQKQPIAGCSIQHSSSNTNNNKVVSSMIAQDNVVLSPVSSASIHATSSSHQQVIPNPSINGTHPYRSKSTTTTTAISGHKREISCSTGSNTPIPPPLLTPESGFSLLTAPLPTMTQDMFLDIFPGHFRTESKGQLQADQFLLELAEDDDWAIGGFDIEMSNDNNSP